MDYHLKLSRVRKFGFPRFATIIKTNVKSFYLIVPFWFKWAVGIWKSCAGALDWLITQKLHFNNGPSDVQLMLDTVYHSYYNWELRVD